MKSEWKKKEWLSMEALTEVNYMYRILKGTHKEFYKQVNLMGKEKGKYVFL